MATRRPGRVTAVVVNHNSGGLLAECAGSLLACADVAAVLVVDNASTDDSVALLRAAYPDAPGLVVDPSRENAGYARGVNRGLARVETEFALVVNPDCVVAGELVGALVGEADRNPRVAVCGGLVLGMDGMLQGGTRRSYPDPRRTLRRAVGIGLGRGGDAHDDFDRSGAMLPAAAEDVDAVSGALMLVRMEAVRAVGGMDEGYFLHCEDLDWCVGFRRAGWSVRFVPAGFAVHVRGVSGRDRPLAVQRHLHRGMARFYRKFEAPRHGRLFNAVVLAAIRARFAALAVTSLTRLGARRAPGPRPAELDTVRELRRRADGFRPPATLVIGATAPIAEFLLRPPGSPGDWTLAVSRSAPPLRLDDGVVWLRSTDGANLPGWARSGLRRVVHLAPLWTLPAYLDSLDGAPLERVVACSSTSVLTKRDSPDPAERDRARRLAAAEDAVRSHCAARGIELVVLRPTLIYAPGRDRGIERIARFARRAGVFPIAGRGDGLRQPVHAADVAAAVRAALERPEAAGRCYTVSGGETLSYREMVERVFRAAGRTPRIVSIPAPVYRLALRALAWLPSWRAVPPRAADRMDENLAFDHDAAARDLDFRPRPFLEPY